MQQITVQHGAPLWAGFGVGVASAACFGIAGALGKPLLLAGWTPAAVALLRVGGGALLLLPWVLWGMQGKWHRLRHHGTAVLGYGLFGVAGAQLAYFSAVETLSVAVALLLEYSAVVLVVGWMWIRHAQRPTRLTGAGVLLALAGLVLVLGLLGGATISVIGVLWALGAAVGLAVYFVLSADDRDDPLPPVALAGLGLSVGAVVIGIACAAGLFTLRADVAAVTMAGESVAWWVPGTSLIVFAAVLAYSAGIVAARRLGARLMSFVGLTEVLFAVGFAWLLLGEQPGALQAVGGVLLVVGVVVVRLGETRLPADAPHLPGDHSPLDLVPPGPGDEPVRPSAARTEETCDVP